MTKRTTRQFGHALGPASGRAAEPCLGVGKPGATKSPAAIWRQGDRDRALDRSTSKVGASHGLGLELLAILAKLGFAVLLTQGFVCRLGLTTGMSLANPIAARLCAGFFLWSLALISCVRSRHA
jgi:hypothetical protein